jgi:hypothetical protein
MLFTNGKIYSFELLITIQGYIYILRKTLNICIISLQYFYFLQFGVLNSFCKSLIGADLQNALTRYYHYQKRTHSSIYLQL